MLVSDDIDTKAQRMPEGEPRTEGAAITPRDTVDGKTKPVDGPMDRPGTEAEEAARKDKP